MRRALSAVLLALAMLAGTLALAAHVADRVAVGPHRVEAALRTALDSPGIRADLRRGLARRIEAQMPGLSPARARRAADLILADPRLPAAAQALASSSAVQRRHALDDALSTLAKRNPALARRLRGQADVVLPALRLPRLDQAEAAHEALAAVRTLGTVAAVVLAALALFVGSRRDQLLTAGGVWALLMGLLGLAFVGLTPGLLRGDTALWANLASAAVEAARGSLVPLFVALLVGGLLLIAVGAATRALASTRRGRGRTRSDRAFP